MSVVCQVHGPMKYRYMLMRWECVGFDGEDCDAPNVSDEQLARAGLVISVPDAEAKRLAVHWRAGVARAQGREPGGGHG